MEETSMERQLGIRKHVEGELPEVRVFDLLSSIGNGENKALELIVMGKSRMTYSASDLWRKVMSHQAKDRGWRMSLTVPFEHCERSLSPIGLVAREALRSDDTAWGYAITEYGIKTGIPFAGLLLKWSYEHPGHSLYKMFGSTVSPSVKDDQTLEKKRAPETRYKILWEIATNPSSRIRLTDIANAINEDTQQISTHLNSLSKSSIISYDVFEAGKSFTYYRKRDIVPDQEQQQYKGEKTLHAELYDLLTHEYLSIEKIVDVLIEKYPRFGDLRRNILTQRVSAISSDLVKQGYLERKDFTGYFHSQLTVSDEQREAIVSLITDIDKFRNGDRGTIEKGRRFAQRVTNDPNLFSELMLKAKEASPSANRTNREEMDSNLISIVQKYPKSTNRQVIQIIEEEYGKRLTARTVLKYLSRLIDKNLIVSEKTKSGNVYRVVEEESQTVTI